MAGHEPVKTSIREIRLEELLFGKPITVIALVTDAGADVLITGGDRPHIGAVTVVDPEGAMTDLEFSGHREGIVSRHWAERLSMVGIRPLVVSAGIHYDNLSQDGIEEVLSLTDGLLETLEEEFHAQGITF